MKKGIHPDYRPVVFQDTAANFSFLTRSTIRTGETVKWEDGQEYPLVRVDISSASHPFFTGKHKFVDAAGRIEKFRRRHKWDEEQSRERAAEAKAKKRRGREKVSVGVPTFKRKEKDKDAEGSKKKPAAEAKGGGGPAKTEGAAKPDGAKPDAAKAPSASEKPTK